VLSVWAEVSVLGAVDLRELAAAVETGVAAAAAGWAFLPVSVVAVSGMGWFLFLVLWLMVSRKVGRADAVHPHADDLVI